MQRLAGMTGFEPVNEGVKVPCLATWLHSNIVAQPWEVIGVAQLYVTDPRSVS